MSRRRSLMIVVRFLRLSYGISSVLQRMTFGISPMGCIGSSVLLMLSCPRLRCWSFHIIQCQQSRSLPNQGSRSSRLTSMCMSSVTLMTMPFQIVPLVAPLEIPIRRRGSIGSTRSLPTPDLRRSPSISSSRPPVHPDS